MIPSARQVCDCDIPATYRELRTRIYIWHFERMEIMRLGGFNESLYYRTDRLVNTMHLNAW